MRYFPKKKRSSGVIIRSNVPITSRKSPPTSTFLANEIMAINRLKRARLAPGRYLFLPQRASDAMATATTASYIPPVNAYDEETFSDAVVYRIRKGDSMSKIARRFHVTLTQLYRWNRLAHASGLRPGRTLIVRPASAAETAEASALETRKNSGKTLYIVQSGDTPFSIARRAGVKMSDLFAWNDIDPSQPSIKAGDSLRLTTPRTVALRSVVAEKRTEPSGRAVSNASMRVADRSYGALNRLYTVKRGDNLYSISRKFSLPLQTLLSLNHLSRNSVLRPGRTILLPSSAPEAIASGVPTDRQEGRKGFVYYKVRSGDTLPLIASTFGIPLEKLSHDNNLQPDSMVVPGELIKVAKSRTP